MLIVIGLFAVDLTRGQGARPAAVLLLVVPGMVIVAIGPALYFMALNMIG